MNTTLSAPTGRHHHPPEPVETVAPDRGRVGLLDRLALRLGVALITWSRRPAAGRATRRVRHREPISRRSLALHREQQSARDQHEREAEQQILLTMTYWRA